MRDPALFFDIFDIYVGYILDALTALKAMLNGKADFTLVDILRILKASAQ